MAAGVATIEIAVACHARKTPEVLVFAPRAVAPTEHLEGQEVLTFLYIGSDVELAGRLRIFRIADELPVHPQIDARRDTAEMGDDLTAIPRVRDGDRAAVGTHVVVLHGRRTPSFGQLAAVQRETAHATDKLFVVAGQGTVAPLVVSLRGHGVVAAPGKADVHVLRVAVAVQLPDAGHWHRAPRRVVVVGTEEVGGPPVGVLHPSESPRSVEREEVLRLLGVALSGQRFVFKGEERCP